MKIPIDPSCGEIPAVISESYLLKVAGKLRDGEHSLVGFETFRAYLRRVNESECVLLAHVESRPATARKAFNYAPLWDELLAGAETPKGRRALAISMIRKLPCGECKVHWRAVCDALTDEDIASAQVFHLFIWDRRNDIAERKGRGRREYPGYPAA